MGGWKEAEGGDKAGAGSRCGCGLAPPALGRDGLPAGNSVRPLLSARSPHPQEGSTAAACLGRSGEPNLALRVNASEVGHVGV